MRHHAYRLLFALLLVACVPRAVAGTEYRWSTETAWSTAPSKAPPGADELALRVVIPDLGPNPAVAFAHPATLVSADVDGEPIDLGGRWAVHVLPPGSAHKHLVLHYRTRWPLADPKVDFGNEATLTAGVARSTLSAWALGGGLLLLGLGAFGSLLLRASRAWFFFGLFASSIGALELLEASPFLNLLATIAPVRDPLHETTVHLIACGLAGFGAELFPEGRRVLHWLARLAVAVAVVALALHLAHVVEMKQLRPIGLGITIAGILVTFVFAWRDRASPRTRLYLGGFVLMLASGVPDMMSGFGYFAHGEIHTGKWGVSIFVLILGYVLYGLYGEKEKALAERVRDVEALNVELRHQIAERSREIAKHVPEPSTATAPRVGMVVAGRYEILRELGAGGMGQVFEVVRTTDNQHFALKVMHGRTASDAVRFAREAEIAAKIAHPNLVSVADVGIGSWGTPYIVMELVSGGTLADHELAPPAIRRVLREVARGLVALHDGHVIHRDLKPSNVLIADPAGPSGVKLADFGIARFVVDALDATRETKDVTEAGSFLGTPVYMAPELAKGADRASPAADTFAFGVMAWELFAAGAYPFPMPLVLLALGEAPLPAPPSFEKYEKDPALRALFEACLSVDPAKRPTAHALLAALG